MLRSCVLGDDCSIRLTDAQEWFDAVDFPPVQEAPNDWFLPLIILESLASQNLEPDNLTDESLEGPSTPFSTTDCTDLS